MSNTAWAAPTVGAPAAARDLTAAAKARTIAAISIFAGAGVWILTHCYVGIDGGPALYGLMALDRVDPAAFSRDLFLAYGSQDSFTIFSPIYGALIRWMGLAAANMGLLLAAYALWLTGAWRLSHRLTRGLPAHVAFLMMCAISVGYGGWSSLYVGENALSPRPMAEGLIMLGLSAVLARTYVRATVALLLALAVHPIMALSGLGVAFVVVASGRRFLPWLLPVGAMSILGLALAGVEPFGRLLVTMDGAWLAAVKAHNGFAFISAWMPGDWASLTADLALCAAAAVWTGGQRRLVFGAVCMAAVAGVVISAVGADLIHNALIIQLQTWRCAWLPAVVKLPALLVLWPTLRRRPLGALACALLAAPILILTPLFHGAGFAPALVMSVAGLALVLLIKIGRQPRFSRGLVRSLIYLTAVLPLAAAIVGVGVQWVAIEFWLQHHVAFGHRFMTQPVRLALLAIAVTLVLAARKRPGAATVVAGVMLTLGVLGWDARTPWERYALAGQAPAITARMPKDAQILWGVDADDTWFLLRRPAYVSATQANGLLFNRATAAEWTRRKTAVAPLLSLGDWSTKSGATQSCKDLYQPVPRERVAAVCRRSPGLFGVVLPNPVSGGQAFTTPASQDTICASHGGGLDSARSNNRFYFVPCGQFTSVAQGSKSAAPGTLRPDA